MHVKSFLILILLSVAYGQDRKVMCSYFYYYPNLLNLFLLRCNENVYVYTYNYKNMQLKLFFTYLSFNI